MTAGRHGACQALVLEALRTPYGQRGGFLSSWHPVDLSAELLLGLLARSGADASAIDQVIWGCTSQVGAQAGNIARRAVLAAGWLERVSGATVDSHAASSAQAVHWATQAVMAGVQDVVVAGGVEAMTAVPLGAALAQPTIGKPYGKRLLARYANGEGLLPPGLAAEEVARRWTLRRAELDDWALRSRDRAARASEGAVPFVHPVATLQGQWSPGAAGGVAEPGSLELPGTDPPRLSKDEARRPEGHDLASLPPVYLPGGVVTAGNMCLEGDGAAAVLVASAARAQALGLAPKARVAALATTGEDPAIWPAATIAATEKVLAVLSLLPAQIGLWYVHESSSAALLAWLKAIRVDPDRVNPDGGALASAAPLGAVGAGLFAEAVSGLTKGGERRVAVCVAGEGGVGTACVLEVA